MGHLGQRKIDARELAVVPLTVDSFKIRKSSYKESFGGGGEPLADPDRLFFFSALCIMGSGGKDMRLVRLDAAGANVGVANEWKTGC